MMIKLNRLWHLNNEHPVRKIRFSNWNVVFLFAAGIVMNNLCFREPGVSFLFDSPGAEVWCCAAGVLVFAFLPGALILDMGRAGAVLALAAFVFTEVAPGVIPVFTDAVNSFARGLCVGCAFYMFFFALNAKERFLNLIIIQLYFAVCALGTPWDESIAAIITKAMVYILIVFFVISLFTMRKDNIPQKSAPGKGGCGSKEDCCPIGKGVMGVIFFVFIIYMAINAINMFVVNKDDYIDIPIYGAGVLFSILVVVLITRPLGRSAYYTFKIFFVGSLVSMVLLAIDSIFDAKAGSLLYGFAHSLGFIAILYLLGGAARLAGCLKFFRVFCVISFLVAVVLNPVVEYLFVGNEEKNSLIALSLMVVIFCVMFARYPVINKKIFESGWVEDMNKIKPEKSVHENEKAAAAGYRAETLGLTPREKEIFNLMLTEMSVKQIMIELEISKGTFNFHSTNLYRKLGIQSRTELFAKYGRPDGAP